jgi:hypothetical protein
MKRPRFVEIEFFAIAALMAAAAIISIRAL